ncbi:hypothetical protein [Proteiniphilum saccharofermentans]|uniref:hypothetical protein n=1 Tax=Proteiniphilum saccharofermentans TaxID=1642647 RepID=UPI0028B1552B|nr:hypothetical protein [Proteiniphilum saccharofermentans]
MKSKINIIIFSAILFGLTACAGGNSNKQGTHTHDDGSVHEDHATEQAAPKQESFKVEADSITLEADSAKHDHDHDHGHDHSDPNHKH